MWTGPGPFFAGPGLVLQPSPTAPRGPAEVCHQRGLQVFFFVTRDTLMVNRCIVNTCFNGSANRVNEIYLVCFTAKVMII